MWESSICDWTEFVLVEPQPIAQSQKSFTHEKIGHGGHKRMGLVKNNTERAWNRTRRQSSRNVMSIKKITLRTVISLPYVSRGSHPIPIAISYLHCRVEHSNSQHHSLLFAPITVLPLLFSFFPYPSHTHASYRYNSPRSEVDLWYLRVYLYPPF